MNDKDLLFGQQLRMVDDKRVGGIIVPFGEIKDAYGTAFFSDTDYGLRGRKSLPILFDHGLDVRVGTDAIGNIERWEMQDLGLWAEGVLNDALEYADYLRELISKNALYFSSAAISYLTDIADDGRVRRWPIYEVSMTPTPGDHNLRTRVMNLRHYVEMKTNPLAINPTKEERMLKYSTDDLRRLRSVQLISDDQYDQAVADDGKLDEKAIRQITEKAIGLADQPEPEPAEETTTPESPQVDVETPLRNAVKPLKDELKALNESIRQLSEANADALRRIKALEDSPEGDPDAGRGQGGGENPPASLEEAWSKNFTKKR